MFPKGLSYEECLNRSVALAAAIKGADPSGLVAGPCTWGWTDLMYSAADAGRDRYATHADRKAHGDKPFLAWYLGAMNSASTRAGKRLLDYVDVHFYPQGQADGQGVYMGKSHSRAMRALRLRSTRGLWDPSYRDESWIGEPVALFRASVAGSPRKTQELSWRSASTRGGVTTTRAARLPRPRSSAYSAARMSTPRFTGQAWRACSDLRFSSIATLTDQDVALATEPWRVNRPRQIVSVRSRRSAMTGP